MYQVEPLGVVIPSSQDDLQAAVELAAKYKVPILPRGSGSSLGGQAIGEALILDVSRHLDSILEINPETNSAVVEPGVILAALNRQAAKYGLMYGPDPASAERATLGGVIGNNATGAHSILYGMSADHLIESEVILSDGSLAVWRQFSLSEAELLKNQGGMQARIISAAMQIRETYAGEIINKYPKAWRNSSGYRLNYLLPFSPSKPSRWEGNYPNIPSSTLSLSSLLAGSEGTLAVMRRMKVNLVRKPLHTLLVVLAYDSIAEACDDVPRLLEFQPSAVELIPRMILQLARSVPAYGLMMNWIKEDPAGVLAVEFSGDQLPALKEAAARLGRSTGGAIPSRLIFIAESVEDQSRVWGIRKMGLGILDSRPRASRPAAFIEDCAVPVERLGDFVREIERILAEHGTEGGIYAHASAGCLHIRPLLDLQNGEGVRALRTIGERVFDLVMSLGGSMSSEHGDGIAAGEWIERTYGEQIAEAMRLLKTAADPHNLMNPGKMLEAPAMDTHLRFGAEYRVDVWKSALTFDHEHGLAGAIGHCNGQGVCRKTTGLMCPSYQATRDEANSTRGRANLLRAMIDQTNLEHPKLRSEEVFSSLDLCLACKGCTSECPSGVDMPRLKYEFMHQYFKTHVRPLRDYLFGYFHVIAKLLSRVAPLANQFMRNFLVKRLVSSFAGITTKRPFPLFWDKKKTPLPYGTPDSQKSVLFLTDVFSEYLEPQAAQAAHEILRTAGYHVFDLSSVGAGTSFLSKGMIDQARKHAGGVLDEILALSNGMDLAVVGCEPPEVYCLKHEYESLLPERAEEICMLTKRVWLVDEFLLRIGNWAEIGLMVESTPPEESKRRVTFHPHCHQRAEGLAADGLPIGVSASAEMLKLAGYEVEVVDSGCCGMAGTFGFDSEHYDLSMQVGELGVLPKVRQAHAAHHLVSTTGSACRMQIQHGAGVSARHPLELLRSRLIRSGEDG